MSFRERQAAVCVRQPVFSEGRGWLTAQGPPVDRVEGHRSAGGKFPQRPFASVYFRTLVQAGCWCGLCVFLLILMTWLLDCFFFFCLFLFLSVVGKKMHGNLAGRRINQHGHMVAGAAGGATLVRLSLVTGKSGLVLHCWCEELFWSSTGIRVFLQHEEKAA